MAEALGRLRRREEFLRLASKGRRFAAPGLVLQGCAREAGAEGGIRVGFTATRKVGGAVVRNRARRRLRAVAREVLPRAGRKGWDYVLIARAGTVARPYAKLIEDLGTALAAVGQA